MRITSGILADTGSSHSSEWISWPPVPNNQRDNTGYTSLTNTVKCGSRQRGPPLDATHSGI